LRGQKQKVTEIERYGAHFDGLDEADTLGRVGGREGRGAREGGREGGRAYRWTASCRGVKSK